jgi:hypothetical protein
MMNISRPRYTNARRCTALVASSLLVGLLPVSSAALRFASSWPY